MKAYNEDLQNKLEKYGGHNEDLEKELRDARKEKNVPVELVIETQPHNFVQSSDTEGEDDYNEYDRGNSERLVFGSPEELQQDTDTGTTLESSEEEIEIVYIDNSGDKYAEKEFQELVVQKAEHLAEQIAAEKVQTIEKYYDGQLKMTEDNLETYYRNLKTDYHNKLKKRSKEIRAEITNEYKTLLAKETKRILDEKIAETWVKGSYDEKLADAKNTLAERILDEKIAETWVKGSYDEKLEDATNTLAEAHEDALTKKTNELNILRQKNHALESRVEKLENNISDLYKDKNQLHYENSGLARCLNDTEEKLRILVEERNKLEATNQELKKAFNTFLEEHENPKLAHEEPLEENSSEDETFTFGEDKNRPKHRRWNSAPPGALLFPAQQEQVKTE